MYSYSEIVFSGRMRLNKLKKHKILVSLSIVVLVAIIAITPTVYKESWLDPFCTLNIPNRELHPHSITKIGILSTDDPFHPSYFVDQDKIHDLMQELRHAISLSPDQTLTELEKQKAQFFTLHRPSDRFHEEEDYALQFYPDKGIIYFADQYFKVDSATVLTFTDIYNGKISGWW